MSVVLTSRIAQLLYAATPHLNFVQVVSDLHAALASAPFAAPTLTWDCDDIALIDFDAERIVLGYSDRLPGTYAACLTIATGGLPLGAGAAFTPDDQQLLCQAVTDRLERRFPSDAQQSQLIERPLTADLIDSVVDALYHAPVDARLPAAVSADMTPLAHDPSPMTGDVDRLVSRLSLELVTRTPNLISRAIASATPGGRLNGATAVLPPNATAPSLMDDRVHAHKSVFRNRLFWSSPTEGQSDQNRKIENGLARHRLGSASDDLNTVRRALYSADRAGPEGGGVAVGGRLAETSTRALRALASLPGDIASSVAILRRNHSMGERIHH